MRHLLPAAALLAAASIFTTVADAAIPDLQATLVGPAELANGYDQRLLMNVSNVGGARSGALTETLRFSNQVTIIEAPYWCPVTSQGHNRIITCTTSHLNAGARQSTAVRIRAPLTGNPTSVRFTYTVATSGDTQQNNNVSELNMRFSASFAPPAIYPPVDDATMTTCSGSGPFDWSQCSASSYQINPIQLDALHNVLYQGTPVGVWSKPTARTLRINFIDNNVVEATYNLDTVSTTCYRGVGSFPNSTWFARMELCF